MFSLSKHWISESLVIAKVSAGFQILLVGTKSDLKNSDQRDMPGDADISKAEGDQLAKEIKATCYMETSSKTGDGIKEVFDAAMKAAMGEGKKGPKYCILIWFLLQINGFQWRQKIKKSFWIDSIPIFETNMDDDIQLLSQMLYVFILICILW